MEYKEESNVFRGRMNVRPLGIIIHEDRFEESTNWVEGYTNVRKLSASHGYAWNLRMSGHDTSIRMVGQILNMGIEEGLRDVDITVEIKANGISWPKDMIPWIKRTLTWPVKKYLMSIMNEFGTNIEYVFCQKNLHKLLLQTVKYPNVVPLKLVPIITKVASKPSIALGMPKILIRLLMDDRVVEKNLNAVRELLDKRTDPILVYTCTKQLIERGQNDLIAIIANMQDDLKGNHGWDLNQPPVDLLASVQNLIMHNGDEEYFTILRDTIQMAGRYNEVFPIRVRELRATHDRLVAEYQERLARRELEDSKRQEIEEKFWNSEREKYRFLNHTEGEYTFYLPEVRQDLIDESNAMTNCVRGYFGALGQRCIIILIRKNGESYLTLELSMAYKVKQLKLAHNRKPSAEDYQLVESYLEKVLQRR